MTLKIFRYQNNDYKIPNRKLMKIKHINLRLMKTRIISTMLVLMLLAGSCIPSLFPLYTKDDIVLDDRIIGSWDGGGNGIWTIEKQEYHPKAAFMSPTWTEPDDETDPEKIMYRLTVYDTDEEDTLEAEFIMHLLELDGQMYANYYPKSWELDHDFLSWHMIETHNFSKISISDDHFETEFFYPTYLMELIEKNKIRISHLTLGENILVTASTRDLQKFVIKYSDDEKAGLGPDIFKKIKEPAIGSDLAIFK